MHLVSRLKAEKKTHASSAASLWSDLDEAESSGGAISVKTMNTIESGGRFLVRECVRFALEKFPLQRVCEVLEFWAKHAFELPLKEDNPSAGELMQLAAEGWTQGLSQTCLDNSFMWNPSGLRAMRAAESLEGALGWKSAQEFRSFRELLQQRLCEQILSGNLSESSKGVLTTRAWLMWGLDAHTIMDKAVHHDYGGQSIIEASLSVPSQWRTSSVLAEYGAIAPVSAWGNARQSMALALTLKGAGVLPLERARACRMILKAMGSDSGSVLTKTGPKKFKTFAIHSMGYQVDLSMLRALKSEGVKWAPEDVEIILQSVVGFMEAKTRGRHNISASRFHSLMESISNGLQCTGAAPYSMRWEQCLAGLNAHSKGSVRLQKSLGDQLTQWAQICQWDHPTLLQISSRCPQLDEYSAPWRTQLERVELLALTQKGFKASSLKVNSL